MIYSFPTHSANYGNRLSEKSESFLFFALLMYVSSTSGEFLFCLVL